jgi:hypothetical protein
VAFFDDRLRRRRRELQEVLFAVKPSILLVGVLSLGTVHAAHGVMQIEEPTTWQRLAPQELVGRPRSGLYASGFFPDASVLKSNGGSISVRRQCAAVEWRSGLRSLRSDQARAGLVHSKDVGSDSKHGVNRGRVLQRVNVRVESKDGRPAGRFVVDRHVDGPKLTIVTRQEMDGQVMESTQVWTFEGTLTGETTNARGTEKRVYKKSL